MMFLKESIKSIFSLHKLYKKVALPAFGAFVCTLVAGCSNIADATVRKSADSDGISISVSNYNARSIAPGTFDILDVKVFKITGIDYDDNTIEKVIDIDPDSGSGTITGVRKTFWTFVLHAYSDTAATKEVLRGITSVDTAQQSDITFNLSSTGIESNGSLSLTCKYENPSNFGNVDLIRYYICDSYSQDSESSVISGAISGSSELAKWTSDSGYEISSASVSPNDYSLIIEFYNSRNTVSPLLGVYSDIVTIEPSRLTSDTIIVSDMLQKAPLEPENFMVYRTESSLSPGFYTAVLQWDDKSDNEESFKIEVYEYSGSSASVGTLVATVTASNYNSFSTADGDPIGYVSGDLFYGSEEIALKLKTGKLYDFVLYAVNSFGTSDPVPRDSSSDDSTIKWGVLNGFDVADSSPYLRVNTYTLTYNLGGGTYKTGYAEYYTGQNMTEYYIYDNSPVTLITPVAITDASDMGNQVGYPVLYFNTPVQDWAEWQDDNGNTITQVSSFTNITAHAVYNLVSDTAIELDSGCVSATYGATTAGSYPGTGTNASGAYNLTAGNYVTVAVNVDSAQNFDSFDFYVNGTKQTSVAASSTTAISTVNYVLYTFAIPFKGSYTVQVAGVKGGTSYYAEEIAFASNN